MSVKNTTENVVKFLNDIEHVYNVKAHVYELANREVMAQASLDKAKLCKLIACILEDETFFNACIENVISCHGDFDESEVEQ